MSDEASKGIRTILLFGAEPICQRLGVSLGDEVVERLNVALADRSGDDLCSPGLGFGGAFACFGVAEGGFLAAFRLSTWLCLKPSASRIWARLLRSAIIWRAIDSTRLLAG